MTFQDSQQKNGTLLRANQRVTIHTESNQIFNKFIRIRSL